MNQCDVDALSLFLDGELSPDRYRHLAEHLRGCVDCRKELASMRKVNEVIGGWGRNRVLIPSPTEARVHRAVERRRRFGLLLALSRMTPAAVGSSIAALLVLVSVNFGMLTQSARQPVTGTIVASHSLKRQMQPLVLSRARLAVTGSSDASLPAIFDRHHLLEADLG